MTNTIITSITTKIERTAAPLLLLTSTSRTLSSRRPIIACTTRHSRSRHLRPFSSSSTSILSSSSTQQQEPHQQETNPDNNRTNSSNNNERRGLYRLLTSNERQLLQEQRTLTRLCRQVATKVAIGASSSSSSSPHKDDSSSPYHKLQEMLKNDQSTNNFLQQLDLLDEEEQEDDGDESTTTSSSSSSSIFSVVIAGEFNAGKSTLINALVGKKLLETGALPTTDAITVVNNSNNSRRSDSTGSSISGSDGNSDATKRIKHNDQNNTNATPTTAAAAKSTSSLMTGVVVHSVPDLPLLEDLTLIDTPGTNSAWIDHTERTTKLLPVADLILFVTSADRPFSDSERVLLQSIQAYRKSIVIVVNKMDILDVAGGDHGRDAKAQVVDFVTDKASELLGARPVVIPVSARDALSVKLMGGSGGGDSTSKHGSGSTRDGHGTTNYTASSSSGVWQRSNFASLEKFLKESLTTQAKLKSKLSNPIGVSEGILVECMKVLKQQRQELQVDISTLDIFQSQFDGWKKELEADLRLSSTAISQMVREEGKRCHILVNRLNPYNFIYWTLMDVGQLDREWGDTKRAVSVHRTKDLQADVLEHVEEAAESVATRGRAQGQAVIEYLGKRPAMKNQSLVGSVTAASRFEDTRQNLVTKMTDAVDYYLKPNPRDVSDTTVLFGELNKVAMLSSILNVGTVGSGILLGLQSVDPVAGCIMIGSFFVSSGASYIVGTTKVAQKYQQVWSDRATNIETSLDATTEKELDRVNKRILNGVAPYTRFIENERDRIQDLDERCDQLLASAITLRNRINRL